jgi:twitching motility protein PilI
LFRLLADIERRCLSSAAGLPQQRTLEETWDGVLFSVRSRLLIAPLAEIREILNYPASMTSVPGTRAWVRGVANIRGNLLPVIDLQSFLLGRSTVPGRRSRVLVIGLEGSASGLLVDQMVGIRHFGVSHQSGEIPELPDAIKRFVTHAYEQDNRVWPVFSMRRLTECQEFQFTAV